MTHGNEQYLLDDFVDKIREGRVVGGKVGSKLDIRTESTIRGAADGMQMCEGGR
jgi:hypothetical protein